MQTSPSLEKFSITKTLTDKTSPQACNFVAGHAGLPKARVKDAMNKGAVWITRKGQGRIQIGRASWRERV